MFWVMVMTHKPITVWGGQRHQEISSRPWVESEMCVCVWKWSGILVWWFPIVTCSSFPLCHLSCCSHENKFSDFWSFVVTHPQNHHQRFQTTWVPVAKTHSAIEICFYSLNIIVNLFLFWFFRKILLCVDLHYSAKSNTSCNTLYNAHSLCSLNILTEDRLQDYHLSVVPFQLWACCLWRQTGNNQYDILLKNGLLKWRLVVPSGILPT